MSAIAATSRSRQLSDTELTFRGFEDYVSKYRRVLEYFDAFKIGLTATPALHTVHIFGAPIFNPTAIERPSSMAIWSTTSLPFRFRRTYRAGIVWERGEKCRSMTFDKSQMELFRAPDEIKIEVDDFNRKVITESFNRVVCEYSGHGTRSFVSAQDADFLRDRCSRRPRGHAT